MLKGFGVRVNKAGLPTYMVQYRTPGGRSGKTKRVTIGVHGAPWTADTARARAKHLLSRVGVGADPAEELTSLRREITVYGNYAS